MSVAVGLRDALRDAVRRLIPAAVRAMCGRLRHARPVPVWDGMYERFTDVPVSGPGFQSGEWVRGTVAQTERALAEARAGRPLPLEVGEGRELLPVVAALVAARSRPVRVVDFGGGAGIDYVNVLTHLPAPAAVEYHVVESPAMCAAARSLFTSDGRIHFHDSPPAFGPVDIVYMSSVLAYLEDYQQVLKSLCAYTPSYCLFTRLAAGDLPTYVTAQVNLPGTVFAYRVYNVAEIVGAMEAEGYRVILRATGAREYWQENFPPAYRLGRMLSLLFVRRTGGDR